MSRSIDESFYKSKTWQRVQRSYMQSANYLCERCYKNGLTEPARFVHHKQHLTAADLKKPEKLYGFDNLEALCFECHNKEHFGRQNKRYEIDKQGKLIFCRDDGEKLRANPPIS